MLWSHKAPLCPHRHAQRPIEGDPWLYARKAAAVITPAACARTSRAASTAVRDDNLDDNRDDSYSPNADIYRPLLSGLVSAAARSWQCCVPRIRVCPGVYLVANSRSSQAVSCCPAIVCHRSFRQ
jgi:hypothetical protein